MLPIDPVMIDQAFAATAPRRTLSSLFRVSLIAGFLLCMVLAMPGTRLWTLGSVGVILPIVLILLFFGLSLRIARKRYRGRDGLTAGWERLQLNDPDGAMAALSPLLKRPIAFAPDRGRAFLLLGQIAGARGETESATQVFEQMLIQRIGEPEQLQEAQIRLLDAKIRNDELTDAVDGISRLVHAPMNPIQRAEFDLVHLFQQVFMGHHEDAASNLEERLSSFRKHLSTGAAHGYALLAAALHYLKRFDEAQHLWRDATTLVSPDRLLKAYPLLAPIHESYPAAEPPP